LLCLTLSIGFPFLSNLQLVTIASSNHGLT
jgi:hypothetical protein